MGIWKGNVRAVVALKSCKWFAREMGCRRKEEYNFSQDTLTFDYQRIKAHKKETKKFKFVSCPSEWKGNNIVVQFKINDKELYFCLNCKDWVKHKDEVLDQGWSLFDQDGNLNQFV